MPNSKTETVCNTDVAATNEKQTIERGVDGVPAPVGTPAIRPWTADFLLPSIRHRKPRVPKIRRH